jgi:hypothetical protein
MADPAIAARGLAKRFGPVAALDGIDLAVPAARLTSGCCRRSAGEFGDCRGRGVCGRGQERGHGLTLRIRLRGMSPPSRRP